MWAMSLRFLLFMKIRPVYPDELTRAKSLLNGHPVPPGAGFLVGVKEQPVERLVAAIPWWKVPLPDSKEKALRYYLQSGGGMELETLQAIQDKLADLAREHGLGKILTDFSLPSEHPLYTQLIEMGYEVSQTDRYFTFPGESGKSRSIRIYERVKSKIPLEWKAESIRGHDPEKLYALVAAHQLMSPQQFQNYWNTANRERFEEDYSFVLTEGEELLGLFLLTQRGQDELHIHVEAAHPDHLAQSALISACLRTPPFRNARKAFPPLLLVEQTQRSTAKRATQPSA